MKDKKKKNIYTDENSSFSLTDGNMVTKQGQDCYTLVSVLRRTLGRTEGGTARFDLETVGGWRSCARPETVRLDR